MSATPTTQDAKGFLGALFDFSFTSFVTLKFLKLIYALVAGLILLSGVAFFVIFLIRGGAGILLALFVVPLVTLLYLVLARVSLEAVALFFRIGENTSVLAAHAATGSGGAHLARPDATPGPGAPAPSPAG